MSPRAIAVSIYGIFVIIVFGTWLAGQWPGFFIFDTFINLHDARIGALSSWVSISYSAYLIFLTKIWENPGFIGLFQIGLMAISLSFLYDWSLRTTAWKKTVTLCLIVFVLFPLNAVMTIFYTRDWLFAFLHTVLATGFSVSVIESKKKNLPLSYLSIVLLLLTTGFVASIRQDALPLLLVVPFLLIVFSWPWRKRIFAIALLSAIMIVATLTLRIATQDLYSKRYFLTAVINPLSSIMNKNYVTEDKEQDRIAISRVMDFDKFIRNHDEYEIPAFHQGSAKEDISDEDLREFQSFYLRTVWNNPGLFLENRMRMWIALMGDSHTFYYADELINTSHPLESLRKELNVKKDVLSSDLNLWLNWLTQKSLANPLKILFGNLWPALIFCLLTLLCFPFIPISASAAAIVLCRLPVVFLMAPAPQYKYVYGVQFFAFALVPIITAELTVQSFNQVPAISKRIILATNRFRRLVEKIFLRFFVY